MHGMDDVQRALDSKTPFSDLLVAVFNSILEVFLLCAAGYILARQGILDKKTQKQINRLNVSLFTPALLFSKVAFFLTPEKLKELWIIPIWFVIVTSASMVVGYVLGWLFGLRQSQRSFVMAAAMFMNSNALPIALMQSLVLSVPDLAWGTDDNKNAMLGRALTYLTMYSTLGMVVRYSYGVSLLSRADTILAPQAEVGVGGEVGPISLGPTDEHTPLFDEPADLRTHASASTLVSSSPKHKQHRRLHSQSSHPDEHEHEHEHEHSDSSTSSPKLLNSPGTMRSTHPLPELSLPANGLPANGSAAAAAAVIGMAGAAGVAGALRPPAPHRLNTNTSFYNSFPNSPNESRAELPGWAHQPDPEAESSSGSESEYEDERRVTMRPSSSTSPLHAQDQDVEALPTHHHTHAHASRSLLSRLPQPLHNFFISLDRFLTALYNFMTVPLWAALLSLAVACIEPLKHSLEAHLHPLNEAINTAGKCAVPLTLVVLGAYFFVAPAAEAGADETPTKLKHKHKRTFVQWLKDTLRLAPNANSQARKQAKTNLKQDAPRPGESKTVFLAVAARMVITPVLLVPVIVLATKTDWHAVFEDPVFVTVNTILLCSPPALTLAQITAAVSGDAFERLISRTIFWSYCVITPPVTIGCVMLGLWLAKL